MNLSPTTEEIGCYPWCYRRWRRRQRPGRNSQEATVVSSLGSHIHVWHRIGLCGTYVPPPVCLTAAFAFGARWIDAPIAFILGVILALLQLVVAKQSMLYSNVFEISAAIITAFLARAFGSIPPTGLFCFSSLTASSIALILPGYTVRKVLSEMGLTCSYGIIGIAVEKYCGWERSNVVCHYRMILSWQALISIHVPWLRVS